MRDDTPLRLFDRLGGVFLVLALGTVAMTLWWAGGGLAALLAGVPGAPVLAPVLATGGVLALVLGAPRLAGLPAVALAGLALLDRGGAGWPIWALALYALPVAAICLGIVTYALARHLPRAARTLPQVLVLVLGVLFILPVTLSQSLGRLLGHNRP